jgi:hypothetical protein
VGRRVEVPASRPQDDREAERRFKELRRTAVDPRVLLTEGDPAFERERQRHAEVEVVANAIAAGGRPIADQVRALEDYLTEQGLRKENP